MLFSSDKPYRTQDEPLLPLCMKDCLGQSFDLLFLPQCHLVYRFVSVGHFGFYVCVQAVLLICGDVNLIVVFPVQLSVPT